MNQKFMVKSLSITFALLALIFISFVCSNCSSAGVTIDNRRNSETFVIDSICNVNGKNDIVILFTNDVHCAFDKNIGYAGLAAYKDSIKKITENVLLVDNGDAIQGNLLGGLSKGKYAIQLMNEVGYDIATFGNHEFDYGMTRLSELVDSSKASYVVSNFAYTGKGKNLFESVETSKMVEMSVAGKKIKIGFIGALTPKSFSSSIPTFFQENGEFVYDLYEGENNKRLIGILQKNIDQLKKDGANYIVMLSHLGVSKNTAPFRSTDVIQGLTGVDVVLDGHSHTVISQDTVLDVDGKVVLLSSTGAYLAKIGQMVIFENGKVCTKLVEGYTQKNSDIVANIDKLNAEYEKVLNREVGESPAKIYTIDTNSIQIVRLAENGIGNFIADAFRNYMKSDISLVNGGGIRANMPKGKIKYGDIKNITPYANKIVVAKVKGSVLLDALEYSYRLVKAGEKGEIKIAKDSETGGFLQVSGLKVSIDASIEPSVIQDSQGMFTGIKGKRRVVDVQVEKNGRFTPLDTAAEYLVASPSYIMENFGDGFSMFKGCEIIERSDQIDAEILVDYLQNKLYGKIPERYTAAEGRIVLKK